MSSEMDSTDKLLNNFSMLSDMTLVAGIDNEEISVIRRVIAKSSPYFEAMLGPNFREGTEEKVRLEGVDGPTLKAIIGYIYANHISLTRMELVSLEQKCVQFMEAMLTKENCLAALLLADQHDFTSLKTKALMLVCENLAAVPQSDILQFGGDIFIEVLKSDRIQLPETQIFDLMVEWCQQNEPERAKFVPELLKCIRLELIPGQLLCSNVQTFYSRYGYSQLIFDECQKRLSNLRPNCLNRSSTSSPKGIYCIDIHFPTVVYLQKYNSEQSKLEKSASHMNIPHRDFGWVVHDNKLYVMGGKNEAGEACDDAESYDMFTWNRRTLQSMTTPRYSFSLVAVGQYIYAIGGISTYNYNTSECERFDTVTNGWSEVAKFPNLFGLVRLATIEFAGAIYVATGLEGRCVFYECSDLSCLFSDNNNGSKKEFRYGRWTKKTFVNIMVQKVLLAKSEDKIYVLFNDSNVHTYDPRANMWTAIGLFSHAPNMLQTVGHDGEVFAVYETKEPKGKKLAKITFDEMCIVHELAEIKSGSDGLLLLFAV